MHYYPFLIAIYPILYFFGENIGKIRISELVLPLLFVSTLTIVAYGVIAIVAKSRHGRSFFTALFVISFYICAPLIDWISSINSFGAPKTLFIYLLIILLLGTLFVLKAFKIFTRFSHWKLLYEQLNKVISTIALVICLSCLLTIGYRFILHSDPPKDVFQEKIELHKAVAIPEYNFYYIILDGFGRSDILRETYDLDLTLMIHELEELGFYVGSKSTSNYAQTLLSLVSSLNLQYLENIPKLIGRKGHDRAFLQALLNKNIVMRELKHLGYSLVSITSGYSGTELQSVDYRLVQKLDLTEFHNLLLSKSIIPKILHSFPSPYAQYWQYYLHHRRVSAALNNIAQAASIPKPKFVFAHILSPHPPFVFGEEGKFVYSDLPFSFTDGSGFTQAASIQAYVDGYRVQAKYILSRTISAVRSIVKEDPNAIIIIQGDHGPGSHVFWYDVKQTSMRERHSILNAYRVPAKVMTKLYPSISPVNSFRVIFNEIFGTSLSLLPDKNYFSKFKRPYRFYDVTERVAKK